MRACSGGVRHAAPSTHDAWKRTSVAGVYAAGDASSLMTNATFASASGVAAGVGVHRSLIFGLDA